MPMVFADAATGQTLALLATGTCVFFSLVQL